MVKTTAPTAPTAPKKARKPRLIGQEALKVKGPTLVLKAESAILRAITAINKAAKLGTYGPTESQREKITNKINLAYSELQDAFSDFQQAFVPDAVEETSMTPEPEAFEL